MTQEEKQLLLQDLCARLPYGVKLRYIEDLVFKKESHTITLNTIYLEHIINGDADIKPYLRPMSSMTEKEFRFLQEHLPYDFTRVYSGKFNLIEDIHIGNSISIDDMAFLLDCLNKWHLDYRGLIPMGLAVEAPEGLYK